MEEEERGQLRQVYLKVGSSIPHSCVQGELYNYAYGLFIYTAVIGISHCKV